MEYNRQLFAAARFCVTLRLIHPVIKLHSFLVFCFHMHSRKPYNVRSIPGISAVLRCSPCILIAIITEYPGKLPFKPSAFLFAIYLHFSSFPCSAGKVHPFPCLCTPKISRSVYILLSSCVRHYMNGSSSSIPSGTFWNPSESGCPY